MLAVALRRARRPLLALCALTFPLLAGPLAADIPTPDTHFGFRMGSDGRLAAADAIEKYFELVASSSDRVRIVELGATTEGHRTIAAIVSAAENIRRLEEIRTTNQRLADPRTLPREEAARLASTHKIVLAIGCGIHANEVGATQAANELIYRLATATDPTTLAVLQNVVVILIPSLNPDGYRAIVEWSDTHRGTPFEGGPMPGLPHKYAGPDINRDAFMMNLAESRNLARFFYREWHPQVFLTLHQMGNDGPRFFAPPNDGPIDPNYDPLIWREAGLLGSAMTFALAREGHKGVVSNALYDYYFPGYEDSAPLGHNTVCLLTEAANVKIAAPLEIAPGQLLAGQKGLTEGRPAVNFPDPWPGGPWRLRDIVEYELTAIGGLLQAVAFYRESIVQSFYEMGARAVEAGTLGGPFAFLVPPAQHDPLATRKLEELLLQGGIEIHRALEPFEAGGASYPAGTDIIFLAQPYRAYVKTLLERQRYPISGRQSGDPPQAPYDVAGWTLPLQMGVEVRTIDRRFEVPALSRIESAAVVPGRVSGERQPSHFIVEGRGNSGAVATNRLLKAGLAVSWTMESSKVNGYQYQPGSLVVRAAKDAETIVENITRDLGLRADGIRHVPGSTRPLESARVAVYKPWVENSDEGWTRWLLEQHEFPFRSIGDAEVRGGNLRAQFDAIVLPSAPQDQLIDGHFPGTVPSEFAGGLGQAGVAALKAFVEAGGTLVCLDQSADLAVRTFDLPVRDVAREAATDRFFGPGSILRLDLDRSQPLAYGMPPVTAGVFSFSSAYDLDQRPHGTTGTTTRLQIIARYPTKDILLSGWLEGEQVIAGRSAVVQAKVGAGRIVLIGFRAQHRGQSHATFRLLFNAIFTAR